MVTPGCGHPGLIPSLPFAGRIAATVQYRGNLVVAEANCHTTNDLQRFNGGGGVRCGTWPVHRKLCVYASLPMKHQLKGLLILISANDDLFYGRTEDHLLECRGTMTILPNLGKTVTYRTNSLFLFGRQRMALRIQVGKRLLDKLDFFQLLIPPPLQLAGCKPIASINGVVLFKGFSRLILELLQLARQGGTLSGAAGVQFFHSSQTGLYAQRPYRLQQLLSHPAVYRAATKTDTILSAIIVVALAKISRVCTAATPIPYMELASTVPAADEPHKKTLASAYRRHRTRLPPDSQNYAA